MDMNSKNDKTKALVLILYLIIFVGVLGTLFNIPWAITNWVIQWLISIFISSIFSLIAGSIVEAFTGEWLKTITLTVTVYEFEISITFFAIATFIVKILLFGF
jgi:uncharacterized protein involved in response to NO